MNCLKTIKLNRSSEDLTQFVETDRIKIKFLLKVASDDDLLLFIQKIKKAGLY